MRSTYYNTEDKKDFRKSVYLTVSSYIFTLTYLTFQVWWERTAITIFHDESHDLDILTALIINFIATLTIVILNILSISYIMSYKYETASKDKFKKYSTVIQTFNYAMVVAGIIITFIVNVRLLQML